MNVRESAYKITYEILEKGKPSHVAIKNALENGNFSEKRDRAFLTRLVEGTCERLVTIDFVIGLVSKVPVKKLKPQMRTVLRNGIYQILYMDSVPDSAACNESVKVLKSVGLTGLSGFANGVLRRISREKAVFLKKIDEKRETRFSCPKWLCDFLDSSFGRETAEHILRGYLETPMVTIRVNLSKTTVKEVTEMLTAAGVNVLPGIYHDYALRLSDIDDVSRLPGFSSGMFRIQDESSMFVAETADIRKDYRVLDVCAAPGGKTLHAADILKKLGGSGRVLSRDLTSAKVSLIKENLEMCGFDNVTAECFDATVFDATKNEAFDVVICDVPCSGLGIISKKPDIKDNMNPDKMDDLVSLQKKILDTSVKYLKHGGTLMFSTCTLNKHENDDNVTFLCDNLGLKIIMQRQLLPGIDGCDGFFFAKLIKE